MNQQSSTAPVSKEIIYTYNEALEAFSFALYDITSQARMTIMSIFAQEENTSRTLQSVLKETGLFETLPENTSHLIVIDGNDVVKRIADKEKKDIIKNNSLVMSDNLFDYKEFFLLINETLLENKPLENLDYYHFMGSREPRILSPEQTEQYIKLGWEKSIRKRFDNIFNDRTRSMILLEEKDKYNLYADNDIIMMVSPDESEWIGGFVAGDRYIKPEYRGQNLGAQIIVERMNYPALNAYNGTGLYSPAGFASRQKAFHMITGRKPWEKANQPSI